MNLLKVILTMGQEIRKIYIKLINHKKKWNKMEFIKDQA